MSKTSVCVFGSRDLGHCVCVWILFPEVILVWGGWGGRPPIGCRRWGSAGVPRQAILWPLTVCKLRGHPQRWSKRQIDTQTHIPPQPVVNNNNTAWLGRGGDRDTSHKAALSRTRLTLHVCTWSKGRWFFLIFNLSDLVDPFIVLISFFCCLVSSQMLRFQWRCSGSIKHHVPCRPNQTHRDVKPSTVLVIKVNRNTPPQSRGFSSPIYWLSPNVCVVR